VTSDLLTKTTNVEFFKKSQQLAQSQESFDFDFCQFSLLIQTHLGFRGLFDSCGWATRICNGCHDLGHEKQQRIVSIDITSAINCIDYQGLPESCKAFEASY